jgi:hypothetical protein
VEVDEGVGPGAPFRLGENGTELPIAPELAFGFEKGVGAYAGLCCVEDTAGSEGHMDLHDGGDQLGIVPSGQARNGTSWRAGVNASCAREPRRVLAVDVLRLADDLRGAIGAPV